MTTETVPSTRLDLNFQLSQDIAASAMMLMDPRQPWVKRSATPDLPPTVVRRMIEQPSIVRVLDPSTITRVDCVDWRNSRYSFFYPLGPRLAHTFIWWSKSPVIVSINIGRNKYIFSCRETIDPVLGKRYSVSTTEPSKRSFFKSALSQY